GAPAPVRGAAAGPRDPGHLLPLPRRQRPARRVAVAARRGNAPRCRGARVLHDFDHAAGEAIAGVAGGLALVVVGIGMHDHALADDIGGPAVADGGAVQLAVHSGHALVVGNQVVAVANMVLALAGA